MRRAPISLHQLARRLRIDRRWLRAQALQGRLPCLRIGRRLLFDLLAAEEAIADMAATTREVTDVTS